MKCFSVVVATIIYLSTAVSSLLLYTESNCQGRPTHNTVFKTVYGPEVVLNAQEVDCVKVQSALSPDGRCLRVQCVMDEAQDVVEEPTHTTTLQVVYEQQTPLPTEELWSRGGYDLQMIL